MSECNPKDFMTIPRERSPYRSVIERINDFREVEEFLNQRQLNEQARRCMNCGIPFCHGTGCPLGNLIPDFNAAAARGDWEFAWELLQTTSSFPEFTSRVCPALCEGSCTAGINFKPTAIRLIEKSIVETAFQNGWVTMPAPEKRTGKKVAVVGSGPAGLSIAAELNKKGHSVTVFERNHRPGGLLRYGIPDFKLDKSVIDRRLTLMQSSGIEFFCDAAVGDDIAASYLLKKFDAVVFAIGTPTPRDLTLPGRELDGIHFALDFLGDQNRVLSGEIKQPKINARGKNVLIIGGGDTGSDCLGTSWRQSANSVVQIEIMPKAPEYRAAANPWPEYPRLFKTSSSHEEGGKRLFNMNTIRFLGRNGRVTGAEIAPVEWTFNPQGRPVSFENKIERMETIECDLILLALGFLRQDRKSLLDRFEIEDSERIFITGDTASGPSLVVKAIAAGRNTAEEVNCLLE